MIKITIPVTLNHPNSTAFPFIEGIGVYREQQNVADTTKTRMQEQQKINAVSLYKGPIKKIHSRDSVCYGCSIWPSRCVDEAFTTFTRTVFPSKSVSLLTAIGLYAKFLPTQEPATLPFSSTRISPFQPTQR